MSFNHHTISLPNGYVISDDHARLDMELVHASLASEYWALGRPRALSLTLLRRGEVLY